MLLNTSEGHIWLSMWCCCVTARFRTCYWFKRFKKSPLLPVESIAGTKLVQWLVLHTTWYRPGKLVKVEGAAWYDGLLLLASCPDTGNVKARCYQWCSIDLPTTRAEKHKTFVIGLRAPLHTRDYHEDSIPLLEQHHLLGYLLWCSVLSTTRDNRKRFEKLGVTTGYRLLVVLSGGLLLLLLLNGYYNGSHPKNIPITRYNVRREDHEW
jgi:hypothetical protein